MYLTIFSSVFLALSFLEIIVFDEELLLAMCFICFMFFAYSYLNQSVDSIFNDRKAKIEIDLLVAFDEKIAQNQKYADKLTLDKVLLSKIQLINVLNNIKINLLFENTSLKYSAFLTGFASNILKDVAVMKTFVKNKKKQVKLERIFYMFLYKTQIN